MQETNYVVDVDTPFEVGIWVLYLIFNAHEQREMSRITNKGLVVPLIFF